MRVVLPFATEKGEFDVRDECLVELHGGTLSPAVDDLAAAVARAIESPIEFPALRRAIVPGDHVAIVLDGGIPNPADSLGPVIECLAESGVQRHDTVIVEASRYAAPRNALSPDSVPHGVRVIQHDPHERNRLSYLASTKAGTRVYLNREVVDADLVVLVGRVEYDPIMGFRGTASSVFPGLADAAAQQHFRSQITKPITAKSQLAARHESDEVAWLLGVQFALQFVIGHGNDVVTVLAGKGPDVQRVAQRSLDSYWKRSAPRRAELVIAAISEPPDRQGFDELGMALESASNIVREGGQIAVLTAIAGAPGPTLRTARELQDPAKSLEHLRRHLGADVVSTWQIARTCQHARVYLRSRLHDELVEDLGMIPVESATEVQRLVNQATSCIMLNDAQLARVSVEGEDAKPTS